MKAGRLGLVLVALLVTSSCAKTGPSAETGRHAWTIPHVLRIVDSEEPDSLNPIVGFSQTDVHVSMFWAGYLFNWSDQNRFVPELATVVPTVTNHGISPDGKTIVYHLRRRVKWQDGVPFGADDVIFTYRAVMNPNNAVQSRSGYDLITRIDKRDDATIVIHLKRAWAPFVATFFTMCAETYPVLPAHLLARYRDINRIPYNERPIGTGPFTFAAWNHGAGLRFVANPNYWHGRPALNEVDYNVVPRENTLLIKLQTHEADLEMGASQSLIAAYQRIAGIRVVLNPDNQYVFYDFNLANPILADLPVRQALVLATNRAELITCVTHGVAIGSEGDQAPYLGWNNPRIRMAPYDPARSRAILDAAGWKLSNDGIRQKNGRRLALTLAYTTGSVAGSLSALLTQRSPSSTLRRSLTVTRWTASPLPRASAPSRAAWASSTCAASTFAKATSIVCWQIWRHFSTCRPHRRGRWCVLVARTRSFAAVTFPRVGSMKTRQPRATSRRPLTYSELTAITAPHLHPRAPMRRRSRSASRRSSTTSSPSMPAARSSRTTCCVRSQSTSNCRNRTLSSAIGRTTSCVSSTIHRYRKPYWPDKCGLGRTRISAA